MGVVKGRPQLVEKNPQPLQVILSLEEEVDGSFPFFNFAWHEQRTKVERSNLELDVDHQLST